SFPHELSGGQQQRVAFARALIHKPDIILADEPTGNLDSRNSREIIAILKNSIRKYNQTLVLITHDPSIAAQADRIFRMTDGRLTEEGIG
ncbi:MAG: ATP-binding cassette domain-containing protein, partial [Oscillospiraceae bacterium]|nr:ATP-binding cassette domain-containing protein [Oscillospiraceae bacterium]